MAPPVYRVEVDFAHDALENTFTWVRIDDDVLSVEYAYGRARLAAAIPPGTGRVVIHDPNRVYDPSNSSSTHAGDLLPNRRIRIRAGNNRRIAFGWVDRWAHDPIQGITFVEFSDIFRLLRQVRLPRDHWVAELEANAAPHSWYRFNDQTFGRTVADSLGTSSDATWWRIEGMSTQPTVTVAAHRAWALQPHHVSRVVAHPAPLVEGRGVNLAAETGTMGPMFSSTDPAPMGLALLIPPDGAPEFTSSQSNDWAVGVWVWPERPYGLGADGGLDQDTDGIIRIMSLGLVGPPDRPGIGEEVIVGYSWRGGSGTLDTDYSTSTEAITVYQVGKSTIVKHLELGINSIPRMGPWFVKLSWVDSGPNYDLELRVEAPDRTSAASTTLPAASFPVRIDRLWIGGSDGAPSTPRMTIGDVVVWRGSDGDHITQTGWSGSGDTDPDGTSAKTWTVVSEADFAVQATDVPAAWFVDRGALASTAYVGRQTYESEDLASYLQRLAVSDLAWVIQRPGDTPTIDWLDRGRFATSTADTDVAITNSPGNVGITRTRELVPSEIRFGVDDQLLVNEARAVAAEGASATVIDTTSQTTYGPSAVSVGTALHDSEIVDMAASLTLRSDVDPRPLRVVIRETPGNSINDMNRLYVGDRVQVLWEFDSGPDFDDDLVIDSLAWRCQGADLVEVRVGLTTVPSGCVQWDGSFKWDGSEKWCWGIGA